MNAGVTVFISIKTDKHSLAWLENFPRSRRRFPRGGEFYRMSGDVDYLLRVAVPDIAAYDAFYKKLITRVEIAKVSSAFAMEEIKHTTALPPRVCTRSSDCPQAGLGSEYLEGPEHDASARRNAEACEGQHHAERTQVHDLIRKAISVCDAPEREGRAGRMNQ